MGWLSDFISDPVGTTIDTVSNVVSDPLGSIDRATRGVGDTLEQAAPYILAAVAMYYGIPASSVGAAEIAGAAEAGAITAADVAVATPYIDAGAITGTALDAGAAGAAGAAAGTAGIVAGDAYMPGLLTGANPASNSLAAGLGSISNYLTPAAILGSGLLGAGAAQSAAGTQAAAQDRANALNYSMYLQGRQDLAPYAGAGITAQNKLLTYLGLPGGAQGADFGRYAGDFSSADFLANKDPGYGFRMSEGMKALDRSAASRGGLLSGATLKGAERFGQDLASTEYQNAFNRYQTNRSNALSPLIGLATAGQNAAAGQGSLAAGYGASGAAGQTALGNIGAAGTMGGVNALSGALGQYLNYSSNADLANSIRTSAYGRPSIPA